ncbi:glmZ(sRNA)-inactivating NTPase [Streptomyces sp. ADI92-24]|uniref:RapZ C-terminal domain-containing protein n=1 Tax=Streptomyces sp. ADI92-24 TaxID=1522756 RepID=UPI000FC052EC|nr:RNase adapter RapZ [Streptomyces sp. ADI92-24]RPK32446.1 glmZ(sRNA)-inactivating NTPase [Streptomyces sp. ADI92-24]
MTTHPIIRFESFGFLHHDQPPGHGLLYDLREALRNPSDDPALRHLTGLDPRVRDHVRNTEGADELAERIAGESAAHLSYALPRGRDVKVFVGCRGGLHRSVALAEWAGELLRARLGADCPAIEINHRHIDRGVVHQ